jgi:hypothetical protein
MAFLGTSHVAAQRRMIYNLSNTAHQSYSDLIEKDPQIFRNLQTCKLLFI